MAIKEMQKDTKGRELKLKRYLILILVFCVLLMSGCALLPEKEPELSAYEKETAKRIYELSKEMLALLNEKYPDVEFIEVGPHSYSAKGLEFLFSTTELEEGEMFSIEYTGDYLSPKRPSDITGRFQDNYARMRINELFSPYAEQMIKKYLKGTLASYKGLMFVSGEAMGDGLTSNGVEKGSPRWISESFDTNYKAYFDMEIMLGEMAGEVRLDFSIVMFRDIKEDNVDDLYQEIYDLISELKSSGIMNISEFEMTIYEEKWLKNKDLDLESFDEESFGYFANANDIREIVIDSRWMNVYDFNTVEEMKAQLYVAKIENGEKDIWLGGN